MFQRSRRNAYIVSHEHRFVYFIIPKVACSSIKTALLPLFDFDVSEGKLVREDDITEEVHQLFRASSHEVNQRRFLKGLQKGRYEGYLKFAFVRNPWDRLLSCYLQKIVSGGKGLRLDYGDVKLRLGMPFAEFVEAVHQLPDEAADPHFRPQHVAVCGPDGEIMADFVGRFENLEEDFARVAQRIGAPHLKLPSLQPSPSRGARPYRDFYDDETAERVGERFHKDVETFGYSF